MFNIVLDLLDLTFTRIWCLSIRLNLEQQNSLVNYIVIKAMNDNHGDRKDYRHLQFRNPITRTTLKLHNQNYKQKTQLMEYIVELLYSRAVVPNSKITMGKQEHKSSEVEVPLQITLTYFVFVPM